MKNLFGPRDSQISSSREPHLHKVLSAPDTITMIFLGRARERKRKKSQKKSACFSFWKEHEKQILLRQLKNCSRGAREKMPFFCKLLSGPDTSCAYCMS